MKLLFLTPRFPFPPHKGDALRVYHQLRTLAVEHSITLLSLTDTEIRPEHRREVERLCEHVEVIHLSRARQIANLALGLFSSMPLQVSYYQSPSFARRVRELIGSGGFDAVHVTLMRMLPYVPADAHPRVVVDLIDSLTLNLEGRRQHVRGPMRLAYELEYRRVRDYEQRVVSQRPNLVISSPADQQLLGGDRVAVIPNGVDVGRFPFSGAEGREPRTLVFTGNMGYHPNDEAVLWFASNVWPRLRARYPDLRFRVVGTLPSERVKALSRVGIEVMGAVPEVLPFLREATVAVTPMVSGSGIQNKVLEAMSAGAAVVSTRIANRGVQGVDGQDLLLADGPEDFANAVVRALEDAPLRERLAASGRRLVEGHFRWEAHARALDRLYRGAPRLETGGEVRAMPVVTRKHPSFHGEQVAPLP